MSLQIWLPLNGDLHNQGLNNLTATNNGAIVNNNGKIGKCYQFGTAASDISLPAAAMASYTTECSVCFWLNILTWNVSYATFFQAGPASTPWTSYIFGLLRNNAASTCCFTISNGSSASNANYLTPAFDLNKWYHIALVYKTGHCLIYINGQLHQDYTTSIVPNFAGITTIKLGRCANGSSYQTNCLMNDFRIYDHALSPKEVEEIAKGLVLHYQLNTNRNLNLIKNGFGELGSTNWDSSTRIYSDVPADQPEIKASFLNNTTLEFIPVYPNTQYKISLYIKASTTSGNTYPSIIPYDIDKKRINYFNTRIGFNLNTMTTLSRALNPGDTKIYVASLSAWNDSSGHNYNYAALFDYQDSFGYTYPEGVYTQNTPSFGSSTNAKTNLDKTNNIITLNSAYSGPALPIGTKVCASSAGSTYFYPLGSISNSSISDWTYKEGTFSTTNAYLLAARYFKYYTYSTSYQAGIKLINMTTSDSSNIIQDSSGYSHNGTVVGTLTAAAGSPRYEIATVFDGSSAIKVNDNNWCSQGMKEITINFWIKPTAAFTKLFSCTESGGWNTESGSSGYLRFPVHVYTNAEQTSVAYKYDSKELQISAIPQNEWTMLTFVYDSSGTKTYINGELHHTYSNISYGIHYNMNARLFLGCEANVATAATPYYTGEQSDFRIYATALTADQVKELYNISMSVDSNGNVYARELSEL